MTTMSGSTVLQAAVLAVEPLRLAVRAGAGLFAIGGLSAFVRAGRRTARVAVPVVVPPPAASGDRRY